MKTTTKMLALAAGSLLTVAAQAADVELVMTGSTAFRSIVHDRIPTLFDAGYTDTGGSGATLRTFEGTMAGKIPSLGSQIVRIRCSWSGSTAGINAVKNSTPVTVTNGISGGTASVVADLGMADSYTSSISPPAAESLFDGVRVGVVPFVYFVNKATLGTGSASPISNLTKEHVNYLLTASGPGLFPAEYVGGPVGSYISMVGRDSGSGTRLVTEKCVGFNASPNFWGTNGVNTTLIGVAGYASGGNVAKTVANIPQTMGYAGLPDYNSQSNNLTQLSYNGVVFTPSNVASGKYSVWGYESVINRAGQLSVNQGLVRTALADAIKDDTYQHDTAQFYWTTGNVPLTDMQVERSADGGSITSTTF